MHLNNFDLIRLVAAAQVVLLHAREHLGLGLPPSLVSVLAAFPGVPIFFVVSGFLVADSFRRNPSIRVFAVNRALRIFPGLWGCFACSLLVLVAFGQFNDAPTRPAALWFVGNFMGLPHTPAFLKDWGTGSVNGSLWTIPVELQFYLILPVLVLGLGGSVARWGVAFLLLIACNLLNHYWRATADAALVTRLFRYSVLPWLYMFMLGMVLQSLPAFVERWLKGKFLWWLAGYGLWVTLLDQAGMAGRGNLLKPLAAAPLAAVVISAAFTAPRLTAVLLKRHDASYGLYLYHMPVINVAVTLGWRGWDAFAVVASITGTLAWLSWLLVERPTLRLKRRPAPVELIDVNNAAVGRNGI